MTTRSCNSLDGEDDDVLVSATRGVCVSLRFLKFSGVNGKHSVSGQKHCLCTSLEQILATLFFVLYSQKRLKESRS